MQQAHISRYSEQLVENALVDTPVILIHGARQCGKTTLCKQIGEKHHYHYISLDDHNQLEAVKSDPVGFIASLGDKTIIDEIQRAPELFSGIKNSVDQNRIAGKFILTGSANVLLLPQLSDSLAGRMEIIRLHALSYCEINKRKPDFIDTLLNNTFHQHSHSQYPTLTNQIAKLIVQGGYPAARQRQNETRCQKWYKDYIASILNKDVQDIANIRNLTILPKLLKLTASHTANLFNISELASPFSLSRPTISDYLTILENIFLIELLNPWHSNRIKRLIKTPKLHLNDTGVLCAMLDINSDDLQNDKKLLGQLLETLIYSEIRKQADWHEKDIHLYHFRNKDKVEIDFIVEAGQKLAAIEVKASATVTSKDFHAMNKIRDTHQQRFSCGIVLYNGEKIIPFGDKIFAVPISYLLGFFSQPTN